MSVCARVHMGWGRRKADREMSRAEEEERMGAWKRLLIKKNVEAKCL